MEKTSYIIIIMNPKNILSFTGKLIVVFLLFVGCYFTLIVSHELVHFLDFKDHVIEGDICIVQWPPFTNGAAAYYEFDYYDNTYQEIEEIGKTTEFKAYSLNILMAVIMGLVIGPSLHKLFQ